MYFCDLLFSYSLRRNYVGTFNYKNVANMQVQRVFSTSGTGGDVPPLLTNKITGIVVNGYSFGSGRIVSYSNPTSYDITEDGKHLWKQVVNFELYEDGDNSNLPSTNFDIGNLYDRQIESVSESFGFDITENGDYQFSRDLNVKCIRNLDNTDSGVQIAYSIIQNMQGADRPDFGFIDISHSGLYNNYLGKTTNSYQIDKENGSVSWSEKFLIQDRDFVKQAFSFDNGVINVSESATIRHSGISSSSGVFANNQFLLKTRYETLTGGAFVRCSGLAALYSSVLGLDSYTNYLNIQPTQITRVFDEKSQELNYSIVFSNNPNMTTSGYLLEQEINLTKKSNGVDEISENGTITSYSNKSYSLMPILNSGISNAISSFTTRVLPYYPGIASAKLVSENKTLGNISKKANYSITYSTDSSFVNDSLFLTKNFNLENSLPIINHSSYIIFGFNSPLVHAPGQTSFGSVNCSVSAALKRDSNFNIELPQKPRAAIDSLVLDGVNYALNSIKGNFPTDFFVDKVSYSYDSDNNANIQISIQYIYPRDSKL
jgi:hypothetical protein